MLIALEPTEQWRHDRLVRWISACNIPDVRMVAAESSIHDINVHIREANASFVTILADYATPIGIWDIHVDRQDVALIGAVVETPTGKRAGYMPNRHQSAAWPRIRLPIAAPGQRSLKEPYINLLFPNDGVWTVARSVFLRLGELDERLPLEAAWLDYALRLADAGHHIAVDVRRYIDVDTQRADSSSYNESLLTARYTKKSWDQISETYVPLESDISVDMLLIGGREESRPLFEAAGYPIHLVLDGEKNVCAAVQKRFLEQRYRPFVIVDAENFQRLDQWLHTLVSAALERPEIAAVTIGDSGSARAVQEVDGLATLFFPARFPVTFIDAEKDLSLLLSKLSKSATAAGAILWSTAHRCTRSVPLKSVAQPEIRDSFAQEDAIAEIRKIDIVDLSFAPEDMHEFTEMRLQTCSRSPYQLTVLTERKRQDIAKNVRTRSMVDLRLDKDASWCGNALLDAFLEGSGDYLALVTDDVVVSDHWLQPLEAVMRRLPMVGIVAPRVSHGVGPQSLEDIRFANTAEFRLAAEQRAIEYAREVTPVSYLSMPLFLVRRTVIDAVGGIDPRLAASELGLLDFCLRVQAAGCSIVIAEDAVVHRIDPEISERFSQNRKNVELRFAEEQHYFRKKWEMFSQDTASLVSRVLSQGIPQRLLRIEKITADDSTKKKTEDTVKNAPRVVFVAPIAAENDWQKAGRFVKKFLKVFRDNDSVSLCLGRAGDIEAETIAQRIRHMLTELALNEHDTPDIQIDNATDVDAWCSRLPVGHHYRLLETTDQTIMTFPLLEDQSPSALRRLIDTVRESVEV